MKKLNLLAPKIVTGFLEGRGREMVRYLEVPDNMGRKQFLEDIKNGAPFFDSLKAVVEKNNSRTVVIRCDNREIGMMALTYLAGIYNEDENRNGSGPEDVLMEEAGSDYFEDAEFTFEDLSDDVEMDEPDSFSESASRIPIINGGDIQMNLGGGGFNVFESGPFGMQGQTNVKSRDPWWFKCKNEPVCIINDHWNGIFGNFSTTAGAFFATNRHLYVLDMAQVPSWLGEDDDEDGPDNEGGYEDPDFTEMVLEQAAAVIDLREKVDKDREKNYRITQFENWVEEEGFRLSEDFNKSKIVGRITKMRSEGKSELMRQIIHYVRVQGNGGKVLTESDFDILKKFMNIMKKEDSEITSVKKLEKQLYGMEDVKRQVKEIVDVLKFYKRRESLGLDKGGFHNVHLLIGAPGTAKTTVAKLMGNMMCEGNLLKGNRFTCVNGADLKGMYVGHTAPKVKQLFDENDIIMIDEAYSLTTSDRSGMDTFSQEAVAALITQIEDHGTEKLVLFAGYGGTDVDEKDNLMKKFIDSNPGLKSRINSTIFFEAYTPEQMVEIMHIQAKNQEFVLTRKADPYILDYFRDRVKDRNFGNGREAMSLLQNATIFAATRTKDMKVTEASKKKLQEITVDDVKKAIERAARSTALQNGRAGSYAFGF